MSNISLNSSSIVRSAVLLAVLLLAPLTAAATVSAAHAPIQSEHAASGDYPAGHVADTVRHRDTPAETPLHCHLKSVQPQAGGSGQAPVGIDPPLPAPDLKSAAARETAIPLSDAAARAAVAAIPRFILFGNFRS